MPDFTVRGFKVYKAFLGQQAQAALLDQIREVARVAPPFSPQTPYGKPMSVKMTSAGQFGWFSDKSGYRYVEMHPQGAPWPAIPDAVMRKWQSVSGVDRQPDCCLINYNGEGARMGMHQD